MKRIDRSSLIKFIKYAAIAGTTFIVDLWIIYVLTDTFHVYYLLSTAIGFLFGVTANYIFSRWLVFSETTQSHAAAYTSFLLIAVTGLLLVLVLMWLFVEKLSINYLIARIIALIVVGIWNFVMNYVVSFRVAGKRV